MHQKKIKTIFKKLLIYIGTIILLLFAAPISVVHSQQSDSSSVYKLRYPLEDGYNYPFSNSGLVSPLLLPPPSNVKQSVVYDPETNSYIFTEKIGSLNYRSPSVMEFNEYQKYQNNQAKSDYWQTKSREGSGAGPDFMKGLRLGNLSTDRVFGSEKINITPQGSAELIFGYSITKNKNPQIPVKSQKSGSFIFKEKIMMNVTGSIGDKLEVGLNYNTEASFDFENKTKLEYSGKEDEIIKKIEAGDVSFALPGSLITGSQSLFGLYTELQFGRLTVSTVFSNQRSESSSVNVQGGAQKSDFEIDIDKYDVNRHFFLSHFFRDNYNEWLKNPQFIESQVLIESIEVWVVNNQNNYEESRNIVGMMDLAEGYNPIGEPNFNPNKIFTALKSNNQPADNNLNTIYQKIGDINGLIRDNSNIDVALNNNGFVASEDYDIITTARPLSTREYTVNKELGYISLNSPLRSEDILAVSYVYSYKGKLYKVGELAADVPEGNGESKTIITKLLKGSIQTPKFSNWDLMMKNVYAIGAFQVGRENFILDVLYRNDKTGVSTNIISEPNTAINEQILLKVIELDNLDARNEPYPDGSFDFIEGVTINSRNGRITFPLVEPFGKDLRAKFIGDSTHLSSKEIAYRNRKANLYVYEELYDSTQTKAQQIAEKNKFYLKGSYQSSNSSDIQLNAMNIPNGSVKVLAGGVPLIENVDYQVDYTLGRVKILNPGLLESGTPIKVSLESNSFFNMQQKTLMGTHLDYKFSENFNVGGTLMRLNERPLTEKVNIGEEAISNTIWGLNTSYRHESQLLTTIVDAIPLIDTKEPSSFIFDAEFAQLIPGQSKITGPNGIAYIDDFEGAQTKIELKSFPPWTLCSAPITTGSADYFLNSNADGIQSGYNRAKLSWYNIDPTIFYGTSSDKPSLDNKDINSHEQREILMKELFPNKDNDIAGFTSRITTLNLNYYPSERGPYNYNPDLSSVPPEENWGGIMREINNSDFETSNIEYIEFWLMDPYIEDPSKNPSGGDLYIQLGEISEDILRDGEKTFENGFPISDDESNIKESIWGYYPTGKSIVNAFDNDPESRKYQDIGLDGLNDADEARVHSEFADLPDPSGDNFEYYLGGTHDANGHNILERYKNYNGMEKNSPAATDEFAASNRSKPDVEDINGDNTLNKNETYYQYRVKLRKEDFNVGSNFIVNEEIGAQNSEGIPAKWYQFRIPISEFEDKTGPISDFKSIRFLRMMLTGFTDPLVLRFATLELVRGDWRRYDSDLQKAIPSVNKQNDGTSFEVSAVNIEENGNKTPVNYILPPGVTRSTDPSQSQLKQLNEQSILLKVKDLQENDGRAIYKNTQQDFRLYKYLEMYIHAEALPGMESELKDKDITAFIRIGSDYQNNYYEYEIPLEITPEGSYSSDSSRTVWPAANNLKLNVQKFVDLKVERDKAIGLNPLVSTESVYVKSDGGNKIKVKGHPNLSNVRQIMLGVRNPGDEFNDDDNIDNDGRSKSAEVWFNELRLEEFNNEGGWAANGHLQVKLADLGILNFAGATSKAGFGSIEQKTEERQKEEINQLDVSSNLELGKFFPEKSKVSIPFYVGYSNTTINPEYYPADPDRKLKDVIAEAKTEAEKKNIKKISQDKTERSSINVTNVRWNKQFKKFKLIQPSNISATVLYTETKSSNFSIDYNTMRKYGASLNYVYNNRPKNITPLNSWKPVRKPAFRIIRDFNFNALPSSFTFSTKFDRNYQSMKIRNVYEDVELVIDPTTNKGLYWDRAYTLRWDLTKALKFDYTASNSAIIDEPKLDINGKDDYRYADWFESNNQYWKDSVRQSIRDFGRTMEFNQKVGLSYTLPLQKIPLLNWTNLKASYDGTYSWLRGPIIDKTTQLGNTIKNSNTIKLQSSFNMKNLYNKVGYFKELDRKYSGNKKAISDEDKRYKTVEFSKRTFINKGKPKNINHKLGTEDVTIKVTDDEGNVIDVKTEVISLNKVTIEADEDMSGINVFIEGKIEKGENPFVFIGENTVRFLLGFKNINLTYSVNSSTMLNGFLPETDMIGIDMNKYYGAPGLPFTLGWQDEHINTTASENDWLTKYEAFNTPTLFGTNKEFNYRSSFEPFKGFRIDFSGMRRHAQTSEQKYFNIGKGDEFHREIDDPYVGGSYSRSIITLGTAFDNISSSNNWQSSAFNKLKENRAVISQRLSASTTKKINEPFIPENAIYTPSINRPIEPGYGDGYSSASSEVLMYSFLSAYTGASPNNMILEPFSWIVLPGWKITFDGLSNLNFVQKFLKTLTLSHSYKSTYSIGQYSTNVEYFDTENKDQIRRDIQGDFIPEHRINAVSINEQFSPLIGFDMTWHNSMLMKIEWKKSRLLALSLNNQQLTESRNQDFVFGVGYKFKDVPLNISTTGGSKQLKSDLNMRFDVSWRNNVTILRSINETSANTPTTGGRKFVLGYTADYVLSQRVNMQFYIDWNRRTPFISTSYPGSEFSFGFSLRLSL